MMKHRAMQFSAILLAIGTMMGCEYPTSLSEDGPAGTYNAITLISTTGEVATNHLAEGGIFWIRLSSDGTTNGHLELVPHGGNPAVNVDLAGTWRQTGQTIDFTIPAGTFVNDMVFQLEQITDQVWSLVGDEVISGTRFAVRLPHDT
jgi:hypothetical protein